MTQAQTKNYCIVFILFLFTLAFGCSQTSHAQDNMWWRSGYSNGTPTGNPTTNPVFNYTKIDTTNKMGYIWDKVLKAWKRNDGIMIKGADGNTPLFQTGNTVTTAPGTSAQLMLRPVSSGVYAVDANIPRGADGTGGGGTTRGMLFPAPCNCQTGADDNTLQSALNSAGGNTIVLSGTYYITKGLKRNRLTNTFIMGNGATIITLNNNAFSVIGADQAPDENTAIQMQNYSLEITNLNITCQSNQIGIEPEPSSNNYFQKVIVGGGQTGFKLEFNLKAYLLGCLSVGAQNGFWVGWGGFPTASINNSQSNGTILETCHTHSVSNYGFDISNSYHVVMRNCLSEGNGTIKRAVNVEVANSTTTKDFDLHGFHFEQVGGATDAIVYLNLGNNCTAEITNVMPHYSGLVVWAKSFGTGLVIVNRCGYAVGRNGKMFKSENVTWSFNYNSIIYPYAYNVWDGTAPNYCPTVTGSSCGTNAFNFIGVIPR